MTIAVDFDGVIHTYSRGWADGTIYDPPLPGALDGLRALLDQDAVFIHTTRDPVQVAMWLTAHGGFTCQLQHTGPFWNVRGELLVTNRKLAATAYLDDRAVRFTNWDQALAELTPKRDLTMRSERTILVVLAQDRAEFREWCAASGLSERDRDVVYADRLDKLRGIGRIKVIRCPRWHQHRNSTLLGQVAHELQQQSR
ncbi:hypothetical protein K4B79_18805 [Streptomyces lincolnensis]|uniref:hypothetical protein n=1 Tax=Streptomyces lincolnensis TaxID=1915 RepID=UPI001E6449B7|nr:hypothetical protein [Streptomyces lincolnensis]MCD7440266.1 hypothetical protein [Streptomyces lincolnensis]